MTLLACHSAACARTTTGARRFVRALVQGGPVGLIYAMKLARIKRRMADVCLYIHRENELHRENVRTLNHELTELIEAQQSANAAAAQFWTACGVSPEVQP